MEGTASGFGQGMETIPFPVGGGLLSAFLWFAADLKVWETGCGFSFLIFCSLMFYTIWEMNTEIGEKQVYGFPEPL